MNHLRHANSLLSSPLFERTGVSDVGEVKQSGPLLITVTSITQLLTTAQILTDQWREGLAS